MTYRNRETQKGYQRQWIAKRRSDWLADNGPCIVCRSTEKLEVDHIDPLEKETHRVWSWSVARRDVELRKCQVLCSECHKAKTYKNQNYGLHGVSRYRAGCRCDVCKECKSVHSFISKLSAK